MTDTIEQRTASEIIAESLITIEGNMTRIEHKLDTAIAGMVLMGEHLRDLAEKVLAPDEDDDG